MKSYYITQARFTNRIKFRWNRNKFKYHNGHVNLLKYAYRAVLYWNNINGEKVSIENKVKNITHPKLF